MTEAGPFAIRAASVLVGALSLGIFLLWAAVDGGYQPTLSGPGALAFVGLLALMVAAAPQLVRTLPRLGEASLALLVAFALWSLFSIAWAADKGEAWDAVNRALLYLVVFAIFLLWPWRARTAAGVLGAYALGVAAIAAVTFVSALRSEDPYAFFIGGRYVDPVGYVNANCALFLAALWPAVLLASRRETPWWLRGLFLASAGFLAEQAILPQSRGSLFIFPVVAVLYLAVVPARVRSLLALGPVCLAAYLVREPLLDVYSAARGDTLPAALDALVEPLLGSAVVLFALGTVYGLVDRFAPLPADIARLGSWILGAVATVAALVAAIALLAVYGSPVDRAQDAWDEFTSGEQADEGATYLGANLGSNRYDFWRVAAGEFRSAPLAGVGAGNFADAYLRERESLEEPLYPHSLPLMVLAQTGLVGGLLFSGFLGCALLTPLLARSRRSPLGNAVAAAAVVSFAYWALHGSIDWFWEFPALAAPAFAWLGLAGGLERSVGTLPERPRGWTRARVTAAVVYTVLLVSAVVSLTLPWLAARELERAADTWRTDPDSAYSILDRARKLNFLSARPDMVAGAIAMRLEDYPRADAAFRRALERHEGSWYAELELAVVAAQEGRRDEALARLDRAEALNPLEETVDTVRDGISKGQPVDPHVLDEIFLQRVEDRTS